MNIRKILSPALGIGFGQSPFFNFKIQGKFETLSLSVIQL